MLIVVSVLAVLGLFASSRLPHDWLKIVGCMVVLTSGMLVFDWNGRKRAREHPHPLYEPIRLPNDNPKFKLFMISLTVAVLIFSVGMSAHPGQRDSAFPFFLAAAFLFLALPQALAIRTIKNYDEAQKAKSGGKKRRKGKGTKRK